MINRPLVFGNEVPAIMINREQVRRLYDFLATRRIHVETRAFQRSFELIRFPGLSNDDVEHLLDQATRVEAI